MLTEAHRTSLKIMAQEYSASTMMEIIHTTFQMPQTSGPIGRGECTHEEIVHCLLDFADVPADPSVKNRLAYYQIMGK